MVENNEIVEVIDQITDKREALLYTEPPKPGYYIIAGSFKNRVNANIFKDEISSKGISPIIIEGEGGLYRVAVKKYETKDKAQEALQILRGSFSNSLWILSQ